MNVFDYRAEVALLREAGGGALSPPAIDAAQRLFNFLDFALESGPWRLPRGYHIDILGNGAPGVCVPHECEAEDLEGQLAYFAADVAAGWLEELCETVGGRPAALIRVACGLQQTRLD